MADATFDAASSGALIEGGFAVGGAERPSLAYELFARLPESCGKRGVA